MPVTTPALADGEVLASAAQLRTLIGRLRRTLQEHAPAGGFTSSQVSVMTRLLTDGPTTLTALARAENMRPQSMSAIIAVLEAAGYVQGTPDPTDGRQTILAATAIARDAAAAVQATKDDWLVAAIRGRLSDAEQADLARSIPLLARLIEPQPESRQK
jgi:DNA-binding MarR family transcriptional regulator